MSLRMMGRLVVAFVLAAGCATGSATPSAKAPAPSGLAAASAALSPPPAVFGALLVSVERGACEGTCPAYRLDIDTDGNVRYEGRFCVHILGPASARLSPEKVVALRTAIARSEFARLPENCCDCGFDDDSHITLTVAEPRPSKTIAQSCGTEGGAAIVSDLAASIDSVVGIDQWVGEDLEHCVVGS